MPQWPLAARSFIDAFASIAPVMNPIGCALLFPQLAAGVASAKRAALARRIAVNAGLTLIAAMWTGATLLSVLGIGMGAVRIAGGLVVAWQAWRLLEPDMSESTPVAASGTAFVPLTIPFTTGPGTLAAAAALGASRPASGSDLLGYLFGVSTAAIVLAVLVALLYGTADRAIAWLGRDKSLGLARLSAFILLCVGIQIVAQGLREVWQ